MTIRPTLSDWCTGIAWASAVLAWLVEAGVC